MEKILLNTQWIKLNDDRFIVLENYLKKPYIWTYVYAIENGTNINIGFYGNLIGKKQNEYIKTYNNNYIVFCFLNPYVRNAEFIKNIYDMDNKRYLKYDEYPDFKKSHNTKVKKVK